LLHRSQGDIFAPSGTASSFGAFDDNGRSSGTVFTPQSCGDRAVACCSLPIAKSFAILVMGSASSESSAHHYFTATSRYDHFCSSVIDLEFITPDGRGEYSGL
jgi:hypothetical protein